jgi:hypothetical protein
MSDKGEEDDYEPSHGMKKGNPRKLPKKLRKVTKAKSIGTFLSN